MTKMKVRGRLLALTVVLSLLLGMLIIPGAAAGKFKITVDATEFYSDEDQSGSGWSYDAEYQELYLKDYEGGAISAAGDLTVCIGGTTAITGGDGTQTGEHGIKVSGDLWLYLVGDADVTVTGGDGRNGGNGIQAGALYVDDLEETDDVYGRLEIRAGRGVSAYGGDGVEADSVTLWPDEAHVLIYGGKGATYGGDGVIVGDMYCELPYAEIWGGQGVTRQSGNGIYHTGELDIGICTMTVGSYNDTGYAMAVPGDADAPWYLSEHMNWENDEDGSYIRHLYPKEYEVTFLGEGGAFSGGEENAALTVTAGEAVDLAGYVCEKDGFYLVGFEDQFGYFLRPDQMEWIYCDLTLTAQWAPFDEDTVLFVVENTDMKFETGAWFVQAEGGDSVEVPARSELWVYGDGEDEEPGLEFLGWTDVSSTSFPSDTGDYDYDSPEAEKTRKALWYLPGSTAEIPGGTVLYGCAVGTESNIVRYDANGGVNTAGGNYAVRVYENVVSDGTLYALGNGDEFTFVREGYIFLGWNTEADGSGDWVDADEELPYVEADSACVYDLYAQWAQIKEDQVLFVANGVSFSDGERYQYRPANGNTAIPGQGDMIMDGRTMLGWTDVEVIPVKSNALTDEDYADMEGFEELWEQGMKAVWHGPDRYADIPGGTVLYAQKARAGMNVVRYEGNGVLETKGGSAVVRGLVCEEEEGTSLYVLDNGDEFTFEKTGLEFMGWNTQPDGSGEWLEAGDELTFIDNLDGPCIHVLYAQWEMAGRGDPGDRVFFTPASGSVMANVEVTSVRGAAGEERNVYAYAVLYQDGQCIALTGKNLSLTEEGVFGTLELSYDPALVPDECRVMLLSTDGTFAPVCRSIGIAL